MIIDKLAEESRWVREFCDSAHVIQAPFAVFPPHESTLPNRDALVPKNGRMISGQFAKPPFNRTVILRVILSGAFAFVLWGGLGLALAALENLFGLDVPPERYMELWILILGLFAVPFVLSGIPEEKHQWEASR